MMSDGETKPILEGLLLMPTRPQFGFDSVGSRGVGRVARWVISLYNT
jgi:hypothetical protein